MPVWNALGRSPARLQWQPTLTAHDPNPPITLENPSGTLFTSGPHACVAIGIAGASDALTVMVLAAASAMGMATRRLAIMPAAYASTAIGIASRRLAISPHSWAALAAGIPGATQSRITLVLADAVAVGVAMLSTAATFLTSAAAVAGSVVTAASQWFAGGGGGGDGDEWRRCLRIKYVSSLVHRTVRGSRFR